MYCGFIRALLFTVLTVSLWGTDSHASDNTITSIASPDKVHKFERNSIMEFANTNGVQKLSQTENKHTVPVHEPDAHDEQMPPAIGAKPSEIPCVLDTGRSFQGVQVNVDSTGNNIWFDAANEPSIAIDPSNPWRMVVVWRQFDTMESNFRQAGCAYSHDRGQTWTFDGPIDPGVYRSDPVVDTDLEGNFYFYSLHANASYYSCQLFKSLDGGITWSPPIAAFGGDKSWMVIDKTGGEGTGFLYAAWDSYGCCGANWFTRSTTGGLTFDTPVAIPGRPIWGVTAVGPDGELYVAGRGFSAESEFTVAKSTSVNNASEPLAFDFYRNVYLGGNLLYREQSSPNPEGLLGQVWIAVNRSNTPRRGNVYLLCSVDPPGDDPLDVHFARSTDGGYSWSNPVRINDDPTDNGAWQWFGTMSVSDNGRIDVIWYDTRNDPTAGTSELFYTYSDDGGDTWAENEAFSPPFNQHLGYPNQEKLGDYIQMISDDTGASIAMAATFNGEQDIYFLRIGIYDCNTNGIDDLVDINEGTSTDCNDNYLPDSCELAGNDCDNNLILDECELSVDCNGNGVLDKCDIMYGTSNDCQTDLIPDECELFGNDCNTNSVPDECEFAQKDCNENSILDECDVLQGSSADCNNNHVPDECELAGNDCNADQIPDDCQLDDNDCNTNGVPDECDLIQGTSENCNSNTVPDECELLNNDCNVNQIPDECEQLGGDCNNNDQYDICDIGQGISADCNNNEFPDECDISSSASSDCQPDGIPDECELFNNDCNANDIPDDCELSSDDCNNSGILDACELAWGTSNDCNTNNTPDECDISSGVETDCNQNGVPDNCELITNDCNDNSVPDDCDLQTHPHWDCDVNTILDVCELTGNDCNGNSTLDLCEINSGSCSDCNANGLPDECELAGHDCNANAIHDSCELGGNDCNDNQIPDDCELPNNDCNTNGMLDDCDIAWGTSHDYNRNQFPDDCEIEPCQVHGEVNKLFAEEGLAGDWFGNSVASDGNRIVVGASKCDIQGTDSGAVYIYRSAGSDWVEESVLLPTDGSAYDYFGTAVEISGNTIIAGAYGDDDNGSLSGSAYVFTYDGSSWIEAQKISPTDVSGGDRFGHSVAINGNTVIVGAVYNSDKGTRSGSGYVYRFNGTNWIEEANLLASDGASYDFLGHSVAVYGNTAVLGAYSDDDNGVASGSAYVFDFDGEQWQEKQKLLASDGATGDRFGYDVAIENNRIVIGAFNDDVNGSDSGSAYAFNFVDNNWVEETKIIPSDGVSSAQFGYSLTLHEDSIWIGANRDTNQITQCGAVYRFSTTESIWQEEEKLLPSSPTAGTEFGAAIGISASVLVIGSPGDREQGSNTGAIYVFDQRSNDCNGNGTLDICEITAGTTLDCNYNDIPDQCEDCLPGDFNCDDNVDSSDMSGLIDCMAGPGRTPLLLPSPCYLYCLEVFDFSEDGDVDLEDAALFIISIDEIVVPQQHSNSQATSSEQSIPKNKKGIDGDG